MKDRGDQLMAGKIAIKTDNTVGEQVRAASRQAPDHGLFSAMLSDVPRHSVTLARTPEREIERKLRNSSSLVNAEIVT